MTDIYLNHPRKRSFIPWGLVGLAVLAVGIYLWRTGSPAETEGITETEPVVSPTVQEESPEPPPETSAPAGDYDTVDLEEIEADIAAGRLLPVRNRLLEVLEGRPDPEQIDAVETLIGDVHRRLVFSAAPMPEKTLHVVEPGDTLGALARRYGTTVELISLANNIRGSNIRVGSGLQILTGDFSIRVRKTENDLVLKLNERFFKRYRVGTGTDSSTPTGEYKITLRLVHPVWYRPDGQTFPYGHPENLLGTHYLRLNTPGIGLHGTWEPESIGYQSSAGCVRLKNEEIEELYNLVPEGTPVTIVD